MHTHKQHACVCKTCIHTHTHNNQYRVCTSIFQMKTPRFRAISLRAPSNAATETAVSLKK